MTQWNFFSILIFPEGLSASSPYQCCFYKGFTNQIKLCNWVRLNQWSCQKSLPFFYRTITIQAGIVEALLVPAVGQVYLGLSGEFIFHDQFSDWLLLRLAMSANSAAFCGADIYLLRIELWSSYLLAWGYHMTTRIRQFYLQLSLSLEHPHLTLLLEIILEFTRQTRILWACSCFGSCAKVLQNSTMVMHVQMPVVFSVSGMKSRLYIRTQ